MKQKKISLKELLGFIPETFFEKIAAKTKVDFHSGNLKITYTSPSDTKTEKYAEAVLPLR